MENKYPKIIGYCAYCKDPIMDGDFYYIKFGLMYHDFCWEQINTFFDSLNVEPNFLEKEEE